MQIFGLPFSSGKNVSSFSMLYTVEKNKESIRKRERNMDKVALLSSPPPPHTLDALRSDLFVVML